jgi:hypothetical protein
MKSGTVDARLIAAELENSAYYEAERPLCYMKYGCRSHGFVLHLSHLISVWTPEHLENKCVDVKLAIIGDFRIRRSQERVDNSADS